MLCVVSIVDSISATSMPVNEFVIYRSAHRYDMHQILIVCDTKASKDVVLPPDVEVHLVGTRLNEIRRLMRSIQKQYAGNVVYHMHHQRSALIFLAATFFLRVRRHSLYTVHSTFSARDMKYRVSSGLCVLLSRYANCVSHAAYCEYSPLLKRIKGERLSAIPNGVDVDRIDASLQSDRAGREPKTLICVGRMIPIKNHLFLIRLMKRLPEYRLVLVGAEDAAGSIRAAAQAEGVLPRVDFLGLLPRDEVFRALSRATAYVSPSLVEGLPVSVLEAMRAGLPAVLSDIAPHQEIVGHCSLLRILPFDETLWADAIRAVCEAAPEEYERQSQIIRATVKERFSLEKMHEQYQAVYQKLI